MTRIMLDTGLRASALFFVMTLTAGPVAGSSASSAEPAPRRAVALTFDDLPFVGQLHDPSGVEAVTGGILGALAARGAPASGFVTSRNIFRSGQADLRMDLLRRWIRAGHPLENHTWSHPDFQKTSLREYKDDAVKGDAIPRMLMAEAGREPRYFRHPYNHTGKSTEEREAFEAFLGERGYAVVPFTVEHADYLYNTLYEEALQAGDRGEAERIGRAYLEHLTRAMAFAEELSRDTFGREIPQILLIHANTINGRFLGEMLRILEERGYRFIRLEQAMKDTAVRTPDTYVGPRGISWLHRWRMGMGKPGRLREEPDPPAWVLDAWQNRQAAR